MTGIEAQSERGAVAGMEREQSGVGTRGSRGVTGGGRRGELAAGAGAGAHHQVHVEVAVKFHGLDLDPGRAQGLGQFQGLGLGLGLGQVPEEGNLAGPVGVETGDVTAATGEGTDVGMGIRGGIEGAATGLARVRQVGAGVGVGAEAGAQPWLKMTHRGCSDAGRHLDLNRGLALALALALGLEAGGGGPARRLVPAQGVARRLVSRVSGPGPTHQACQWRKASTVRRQQSMRKGRGWQYPPCKRAESLGVSLPVRSRQHRGSTATATNRLKSAKESIQSPAEC